ncbi:MAG: SDR family NAD(P)-dependent oxidoreductase, partial [Cyclobacteriaceae bacterium]
AKEGHQMLLHGRNSEKIQKTVSEIISLTDNESVTGLVSDLSDLESVKKIIAELSGKISKIDVLVNNAGVFKSNVKPNQGAPDIRFVVNYFAP